MTSNVMGVAQEKFKNIFGSVLTNVAPASNYRGETQNNRAVLQKLTVSDGEQHTLVSAEAIRSRLREMLGDESGIKLNRSRVINPETTAKRQNKTQTDDSETEEERKDQLTIEFADLPNRNEYADDLLFGFLMIDKDRKGDLQKRNGEKQGDSILRVNYAMSLDPFPSYNTYTMHQSPVASPNSAYQNAGKSALIEREVHVTAFQYPFGLNLNDLRHVRGWEKDKKDDEKYVTRHWEELSDEEKTKKKRWVALLLRAIGELNGVAGNHARTMYPFAPCSIVMRLTHRRAPEFDLYGFKPKRNGGMDESHEDLIEALKENVFNKPDEFYFGGNIVKDNKSLTAAFKQGKKDTSQAKAAQGSTAMGTKQELGGLSQVHLFASSREAIEAVIVAAGLDEAEKD